MRVKEELLDLKVRSISGVTDIIARFIPNAEYDLYYIAYPDLFEIIEDEEKDTENENV